MCCCGGGGGHLVIRGVRNERHEYNANESKSYSKFLPTTPPNDKKTHQSSITFVNHFLLFNFINAAAAAMHRLDRQLTVHVVVD
jgi:hypothetical protein